MGRNSQAQMSTSCGSSIVLALGEKKLSAFDEVFAIHPIMPKGSETKDQELWIARASNRAVTSELASEMFCGCFAAVSR